MTEEDEDTGSGDSSRASGPARPAVSPRNLLGDLLGLALLVAPCLAAALLGAPGPLRLTLNLGPGDRPYIFGFTPRYEVESKVGTHWTTYDAGIVLPFAVSGGPAELSYRLARVLPETAVVEVSLGGRMVDRFTCRGGVFLERKVALGALPRTPLAVSFHVDSHDRKNLGLMMDWLRVDVGGDGQVRPLGAARWRAVLSLTILFFIFRTVGWGIGAAALLISPAALAATFGMLGDPWLTHRLLTGVVPSLLAMGVVGVATGRFLKARGRLRLESFRILAVLVAAAFLLRALAVNHPDFYYPDLRTHARLVETLEEAGLDFLRSPSMYIWEHGVWRTEAYGRTYAFPYSPAFHIPFAFLHLDYDDLLTAMKLGAAAVSVVPLLLLWALARSLGASTLGAALMVLVPTYTSRLSFAFLPALLGHAVDMSFLYWLSRRLDRLRRPGVWVVGSAFVAACQLSYVSGVINISVFVAMMALVELIGAREGRAARGLAILGMGLFGSLLAVVIYYRDFLGMFSDLGPRILGETASASRYPVRGFFEVAYARTRDFFDGVYPFLAGAGLVLLWRRGRGRTLLLAWAATYLLLLLGRAKVPDLFLHGHETLFVTPLVCLAAGEALAKLASGGGIRRAASVALFLLLAVQGLLWQWRALADQLGNAR